MHDSANHLVLWYSYIATGRCNGQVVLGQMVVHDRARMEAEVLPRYFNHASFASLRRQLNYFCFTRVGKGRQRGATYCNEGVVELDDILNLKRRSSGGALSAASSSAPMSNNTNEDQVTVSVESVSSNEETLPKECKTAAANAVVPFVHLPPAKKRKMRTDHPLRKRSRAMKRESPTAVISPLSSSPTTSEDEFAAPQKQIILDLTKPSSRMSTKTDFQDWKLNPSTSAFDTYQAVNCNEANASPAKDEDIMAGCVALLSFSNEAMRLAE